MANPTSSQSNAGPPAPEASCPKDCLKLVFGPATGDHARPDSVHDSWHVHTNMIHPASVFGIAWTSITAVFLIYTAIVTPPMIAFHWMDLPCADIPTLAFDTVIDCFFIVDIFVNFNTGD